MSLQGPAWNPHAVPTGAPLAVNAWRNCPRVAERLRSHLMEAPEAIRRRLEPPQVPQGLVDVRTVAAEIVTLPAPPWSDPDLRFLVRPEMADRLRRAAVGMPADVRLGFWEGLRPLCVQRALWNVGLGFLRENAAELAGEDLEQVLERYVARPEGLCPPHSTGSAVDVAALDGFGRVLNPADPWGRLGNGFLAEALREAGLANYEPEWWHWSYGDDEWARANDCAPLSFAATPGFDGAGDGI
jgi:zinc D-Ala-D-Ala dipeptidase